MKKLNLWLFASLFVAAFTLTACGDDDETPANTNAISGTWKWVQNYGDDASSVVTLVFDNNNGYKKTEEKWLGGQLHVRWIYTGTYALLDGNKVSVSVNKTYCQNPEDPEPWDTENPADSFTATYRINGNNLYVTIYQGVEEGPYVKQ